MLNIHGIPVYVNPLQCEPGEIRLVNEDTPQAYVLTDSLETIKHALEVLNGAK